MSAAPRRPCPGTGCRAIIPRGVARCGACASAKGRRLAAARPTVAARGYGAEHRRWRAFVLARDRYCVRCLAAGLIVPAVIADHIVPIRQGGARFDLSNGQGLCVRHGNAKDAASRADRRTS